MALPIQGLLDRAVKSGLFFPVGNRDDRPYACYENMKVTRISKVRNSACFPALSETRGTACAANYRIFFGFCGVAYVPRSPEMLRDGQTARLADGETERINDSQQQYELGSGLIASK
jgi:hypothetical protein